MTRALLKKQMLEVFSWLYQDSKSGKRRSTKGLVGYGLLYLLLFGFLGVIFGFAAKMFCGPMINAHMGWLYWCMMGLIAIFFGVFGSVFNTYSSLYQAKDNDLLLSMPIPVSRILPVRLSGVYAMGLMYELIVMIPTMIIWFSTAPLSVVGTIHILLIPLVLSLLILVLSAVLGWVVALIAAKVKHKNIITVIVSLIFIAAYYYFYARAYSLLRELLLHLDAVGNTMKNVFYPLYHMGLAAEGNVLSMSIFAAIVFAAAAITYWVLSRSFLKLTTEKRGSDKTIYKDKTVKQVSVQSALLRKELQRFTGSANYMLNCGLGIILMPVSAAALVWKSDVIREFITIPEFADYIPLLAAAVICLLTTMNDMAAPSVSLEGKNLWIAQSLPVSGRQVLRAKLMLQLLLSWIPAIPLVIVLEWLMRPQLFCAVLLPVLALLFSLLMAEIGLSSNLKMPNFHWTSEIMPIKQSLPVAEALFGGWLIIAVFAGIYMLLQNVITVNAFLAMLCAVCFIAAGWLHHWLMTKGARIFETL
jgi:ABC-2 type transport system permease protein